ncbi:hypothetical protein CEXT_390171 [Caerostris extrusa]|uniref:Uncharacterized protein n=1 Tax=Caerostris extrusa TaxID=172846 RepID=A0AAV4SVF9_CAEEX|nr:hypothetical protein CEXT_390171 [Caerostris extrusa]
MLELELEFKFRGRMKFYTDCECLTVFINSTVPKENQIFNSRIQTDEPICYATFVIEELSSDGTQPPTLTDMNFYSISMDCHPSIMVKVSVCCSKAAGAAHWVAGEKLDHFLKKNDQVFNNANMDKAVADGHVQKKKKKEILTTTMDIGVKKNIKTLLVISSAYHPCQLRENRVSIYLNNNEQNSIPCSKNMRIFPTRRRTNPFIEHPTHTRDHLPIAVPQCRTSQNNLTRLFFLSPIRPLRKHGRPPRKTGRLCSNDICWFCPKTTFQATPKGEDVTMLPHEHWRECHLFRFERVMEDVISVIDELKPNVLRKRFNSVSNDVFEVVTNKVAKWMVYLHSLILWKENTNNKLKY